MQQPLELLAPAKNLEQGRDAINHGADAVYIGASAFGARVAAPNPIADIEQLARYAHLYNARLYATVNTLLFDNEIQPALQLIRQLYNAGADAIILQDLGLLECDLPPIELHASTQTHNYSPTRIQFLSQIGFKRIILARETSLSQIRQIHTLTPTPLEAFIHGALCVSFSGQCYMSQYLNQRSGNRGCCAQPCRSAYDLYNSDRKLLRHEEHLLSLKDLNASQHIRSMIDAGITSFKIEGRLKDSSYVKNITAYYRQILDHILEGSPDHIPASAGRTTLFFTPDPERTFSRGFTDYFLRERHPMASPTTQKSLGKQIGKVTKITHNSLTINTRETLTPGDGLCFFPPGSNQLQGFLVNHVSGSTITPNRMPEIAVGTELWRNNDYAFEKLLQSNSAERKINLAATLTEHPQGLTLTLTAPDGTTSSASIQCDKSPARDPQKALSQIQTQISKLGGTPFTLADLSIPDTVSQYFIPTSTLNELRRQAVQQLADTLSSRRQTPETPLAAPSSLPYPDSPTDYRLNILNQKASQFYQRHGVTNIEYGLEKTQAYDNKALMTSKYCLRYELGQCFNHKNNNSVAPDYQQALYLRNNKNWFQLQFDCKNCQMLILKSDPLFSK